MNNKIRDFKITNLEYVTAETLFHSLNRGYNPSILCGEGPSDISERSIIGINPFFEITLNDTKNLWNTIREVNNSTNFHSYKYPVNRLGAIGFLSYEALHGVEDVKKQTKDLIEFPIFNYVLYETYYYFDNKNSELFKIELNYEEPSSILQENSNNSTHDKGYSVGNLRSDFSKEEYVANVKKIQDYITNGEVYEVNLTQGMIGEFSGSPYSLFKKLYSINKAPFSGFLSRDNYSVVTNSPEMFIKLEDGIIETRPIKGTSKRSSNYADDQKLKKDLLKCPKNQAELYMITDLMRNDLSKVCKVGTVEVVEKKRIESYKNVHQLISVVKGEFKNSVDIADLLRATFPGGSITGCPKIRCMEITEEIEYSSRNLYTGSIFLMNKNFLVSNIVIRSATIKDNKIVLNSGGAITIDSDPEDEHQEIETKLKTMYEAIKVDS